jgi:two-component system chemotaxis response regulator CheY
MRLMLRSLLRDSGLTNVVEAVNGEEAWEILSRPSREVDLIIADQNMPHCSGLELLKRVRADARLSSLPFMMVSAESTREMVADFVKAGVSSYLKKPFAPENFRECLRETGLKAGGQRAAPDL